MPGAKFLTTFPRNHVTAQHSSTSIRRQGMLRKSLTHEISSVRNVYESSFQRITIQCLHVSRLTDQHSGFNLVWERGRKLPPKNLLKKKKRSSRHDFISEDLKSSQGAHPQTSLDNAFPPQTQNPRQNPGTDHHTWHTSSTKT